MAPNPDHFQLLHDPTQRSGSLYFEILPGPYQGVCWNWGSVFIKEEVFAFWEVLIERRSSSYGHWAFTELSRETWKHILEDLSALATDLEVTDEFMPLRDRIRFLFQEVEAEFVEKFPNSARRLAALTREFVAWAETQLRAHQSLTILGI